MLRLNISLTPTTTSTTSNATLANNTTKKQSNSELYNLFITIIIEKFSKNFIEAGEYFIAQIYDPSQYCNPANITPTTTPNGHNSDPTTNNNTPTDGSKISLHSLFKHYEYNEVLYNSLINILQCIQDQSLKGYVLIDIIINVSCAYFYMFQHTLCTYDVAYTYLNVYVNILYMTYDTLFVHILLCKLMNYYFTYKHTTTFLTPYFHLICHLIFPLISS